MLSRARRHPSTRSWLRYGTIAGLLLAGLSQLQRLPPWPVSHVAIHGNLQHVQPQQLQHLITPYLAAGFFHLELNRLRDQLEQQPWVASASLRRAWPDTLAVNISERLPVAQWQHAGLLTQTGLLFEPPLASLPHDLPKLSGPDPQTVFKFWQNAQTLLNQHWQPLFKQRTPQIIAVDCSQRHDWRLLLSDQSTILLGRDPQLIEQRLQQLAQAYPQLPHIQRRLHNQHPAPRYLDFRYPHGFALKQLNT